MSKKRCVCAAMVARTDPASAAGWGCEYHGFERAGTANPSMCAELERRGELVQVGVEAVEFFATEGGGCTSVVVMAGGELVPFPHAAHLAVRCPKPGPHLHAPQDSPLKVKDDMSDPSEAA